MLRPNLPNTQSGTATGSKSSGTTSKQEGASFHHSPSETTPDHHSSLRKLHRHNNRQLHRQRHHIKCPRRNAFTRRHTPSERVAKFQPRTGTAAQVQTGNEEKDGADKFRFHGGKMPHLRPIPSLMLCMLALARPIHPFALHGAPHFLRSGHPCLKTLPRKRKTSESA